MTNLKVHINHVYPSEFIFNRMQEKQNNKCRMIDEVGNKIKKGKKEKKKQRYINTSAS